MLALCMLALLAPRAGSASTHGRLDDQVLELELSQPDPALPDRGVAASTELEVDFEGVLHVWVGSPRDVFLRVREVGGAVLAEDETGEDGSGPHRRLAVRPDMQLRVTVALAEPGEAGRPAVVELHLAEVRESEETRAVREWGNDWLREVRQALAQGDHARGRAELGALVDEALAVDGASESAVVESLLWQVGDIAFNQVGDLGVARRAYEAVDAQRARTLPPDDLNLATARLNLGTLAAQLGDLPTARRLLEQALAIYERRLADEDAGLQVLRGNLSVVRKYQGDLEAALELDETAVAVCERTMSADAPDLQVARINLADTLHELGRYERGRDVAESALVALERSVPANHRYLQLARTSAAALLSELGHLERARALQEDVVEVYSTTLDAEHPDRLRALGNLAGTIKQLGDLQAARMMEEEVLAGFSRMYPGDHPDVQTARAILAITLKSQGDYEGALALELELLEVRERTLPGDHPETLAARQNLASTYLFLARFDLARQLCEEVLAALERSLPPDHRHLQVVRKNLAIALAGLGEMQRARELKEQALASHIRSRPDDRMTLAHARHGLADTVRSLGDLEGFERLVEEFADDLRTAFRHALLGEAPREAHEFAAGQAKHIGLLLAYAEARPELLASAFEIVETARNAGLTPAAIVAHAEHDERTSTSRARAAASSAEVARLVRVGARRDELVRAVARRDQAQRALLAVLSEPLGAGSVSIAPTAKELATVSGPGRALIGYWCYPRYEPIDGGIAVVETEHLLAFIVRADRDLARVELGPTAEIERAVHAWRRSLGVSQAARAPGTRPGVGVAGSSEREAGEALRRRILDPLLPALEGSDRWAVVADDVLHLVPFDALPLGDGRLSDRVPIETHLTLRELLWRSVLVDAKGVLVAVGGADYDATDSSPADAVAGFASAGAEEPVAPLALLRDGPWEAGFAALPGVMREVDGLREVYLAAFGDDAGTERLSGSEATSSALAGLAPRSRFLHVATHGWFASDSRASWSDRELLDAEVTSVVAMTRDEQLRGLSPMVLCGLALAGANRGPDALGRTEGLVTAEEIAGWNLAGCELAVLSACDTNVGVRRAGQGVASLQRALHMAGARNVITSLWKVPDEATAELMLEFYRRLWLQRKPAAQALWEAKSSLRARRDARGRPVYGVRDWGAWVLTGEGS